ncbi:acyl-CoA dehydrogenase [Mangrovivirga sp. M17]|uniref:Acyl-CoA dehydrogenase n=1 Tax=Mangrovivirga halotolerans TaxID=2993936 RepID=A0ABT3RUF5_9BACT|nr:acyl-CoA dehydrogenase [Mangrovivirga halotolerans]MCX2745412.1 acyl-CoA dehydrogenase [Mangrovivirga halotolerans]
MAKKYVDINTLKYLLYDVYQLEEVLNQGRFDDHDISSMNLFLDSVKDFSDRELYPYFKEMDEHPAHYKDGGVEVHKQVGVMMKQGGEMGFISGPFDYEEGGLQLPMMLYTASSFIQEAANNHLTGYTGLTLGAAELIINFASQELKDTYVPKMLSGDWGGTMCLTEPQAGSSLSDITTKAIPQSDGSYKISGQKIFISGGDHQYADNIVHLVLARIEGAPAGTKGISLFVVPKKRPDEDGNLVSNDVTTVADFQKMGQRGYCTTHLGFGDAGECRGYLVGEANKGLKYMFLMMNGARIAVGRGGAAIATAAYHASLEYAKERPQGRKLASTGKKDPEEGQTFIINHPDVRRMLLFQKTVSEGSLGLVLLASKYYDLKHTLTDKNEKEKYGLLLELIIPMVKTYPSEMGAQSVSNGLQVLGGYGFCTDFILQQYHRDIRIFSIYEGTTGIQSQDLLGRKLLLQDGKALQLLTEEIKQTINSALKYDDLKIYAGKLGDKLQEASRVIQHLIGFAKKGDYERFLSDATPFMEYLSTITLSWIWLEMAANAKNALVTGKKTYSEEFYESKIHSMKFYFKYELPKTNGLAEVLQNEEVLTIAGEKEVFN